MTPKAATVPTNELREAVELELTRRRSERRAVCVERTPSLYATSAAIEDVEVRLDSGEVLSLLLKDMSRGALLEEAQGIKPRFVYDPRREVETYRVLLEGAHIGTASCYAAVADDHAGRYWLLLEKVAGVELFQVGDFGWWRHVAGQLAGMHHRLAPEVDRVVTTIPLLIHDGRFYRRWLARARHFAAAREDDRRVRLAMARLAACHEALVERLLVLPLTVVHGEYYASNVLVERRPDGLRVCPVDWEMAGVGPGLADLAALVSGGWCQDEQAALALEYRASLAGAGSKVPEPAAFLEQLGWCQLQLCIQWLGWSREWRPPATHAQDWLGEALELADRFAL